MQLRLLGDVVVEWVPDRGSVSCEDWKVANSEIKREIKTGRTDNLFKLSPALHDRNAAPANLGKAARGRALPAPQVLASQRVARRRIPKDTTFEQTFGQIDLQDALGSGHDQLPHVAERLLRRPAGRPRAFGCQS